MIQTVIFKDLQRLLLALAMLGGASAAQFGNFTYTDNGSSITITAYTSASAGPITIPAAIYGKPVNEIGNGAFKSRTGITAITFSGSMSKIGQEAFSGCTGLGSILLPSGINRIESKLFYGCSSLKSVSVPAGVTLIGVSAFGGCESLLTLNIPAGVTSIGSLAFDGCGNLQSLSLPSSLTSLGVSSLFGVGFRSFDVAVDNPSFSSSNGVLFNKSQTTLVRYPPKRTGSSYAVPASVSQIGDEAFQGCPNLTSITLPSGLTAIGEVAFASCTNLTSINLPQGIDLIPYEAFYGCTKLPSIIIPGGVKLIDHFAFQGCQSLARVTLPAGLETIVDTAFESCGLTEIHLPASVKGIGFAPFQYCDKLKSITVDQGNPNYSSVDGVLFNKNQTTLLKYPTARMGRYQIPQGVNKISAYSFEEADGLTAIIVPSTVTVIDGYAFHDCNNLTSVTFPAGVTAVGPNAFSSCDNLQQAIFRGDAPLLFSSSFSFVAPDFSIGYHHNRNGFSSPTWEGYPTINLGDRVDVPQDITIEEAPGVELTSEDVVTGLGATPIGSSSTVTLTIKNTGTDDLTNIAVSKYGNNSGNFKMSGLASDYLIGGDSMTFQITFSPKAPGRHSAALQIASSDADENPFELALSGTGTSPEISIEQPAGSNVADGGSRNFGSTMVGGTTKLAFTINNSGTSALAGLATSVTGENAADFKVSSAPETTVAPGGSTGLIVTFKPSGTGTRGAVLHVRSNDSDESPYDINLSGKGLVMPEITIEQPAGRGLVDGGSKKSFGTVAVGKTGKSRRFIIKNTGSAKLTGLKFTLTGKHRKDFLTSALSQTRLAPGERTSFRVEFKPSAKGTRTATIHIKSNDADENPFDIKLAGAGVAK